MTKRYRVPAPVRLPLSVTPPPMIIPNECGFLPSQAMTADRRPHPDVADGPSSVLYTTLDG